MPKYKCGCPVNLDSVRASLIKIKEPPMKEVIVGVFGTKTEHDEGLYFRKLNHSAQISFANATITFAGKRVKITIEEIVD